VLSFGDARDAEDAALKTLYISYFGMTKHLSHSQVIPYLQGLTAAGIDVTLLSFEEKLAPPEREREELANVGRVLAASKINWRWLRYHKRPSIPATAYDVALGTLYAAWLVLRNRIDVVHSRGYVPLPMALFCKWFCGAKLVFDVRGLMAEEYVDAGHWKQGSLPFRITKWFERRAFRNAAAVIVLTERVRDILRSSSKELQASKAPVHVIPCCAEVDRFENTGDRDAIRKQLGIAGGLVLAYVGSLGTWYMGAEMVRFFKELLLARPEAMLLILTQTPEVANNVLDSEGVLRERYLVRTVSPEQVPNALKAADAGVAFIKPCYSKISSSPTKIAEYLAAGLPIVSNRGIGDLDALVEGESVGTLVRDFTREEYSRAVKKLLEMLDHDAAVRERCRRVVRSKFSMKDVGQPAYVNVYRELETRSQ
jgi:glycosyltransferase involved in cell wall biosynthesis